MNTFTESQTIAKQIQNLNYISFISYFIESFKLDKYSVKFSVATMRNKNKLYYL